MPVGREAFFDTILLPMTIISAIGALSSLAKQGKGICFVLFFYCLLAPAFLWAIVGAVFYPPVVVLSDLCIGGEALVVQVEHDAVAAPAAAPAAARADVVSRDLQALKVHPAGQTSFALNLTDILIPAFESAGINYSDPIPAFQMAKIGDMAEFYLVSCAKVRMLLLLLLLLLLLMLMLVLTRRAKTPGMTTIEDVIDEINKIMKVVMVKLTDEILGKVRGIAPLRPKLDQPLVDISAILTKDIPATLDQLKSVVSCKEINMPYRTIKSALCCEIGSSLNDYSFGFFMMGLSMTLTMCFAPHAMSVFHAPDDANAKSTIPNVLTGVKRTAAGAKKVGGAATATATGKGKGKKGPSHVEMT